MLLNASVLSEVDRLKSEYASAAPFPHVVIDAFLQSDVAKRAGKEFPPLTDDWIGYMHVNENKYANIEPMTWGPTLQALLDELQSQSFISFLEELTGIQGLLPDHELAGGGLHQSIRGGYLNVHADFTVHPRRRDWQRRVNVLVYFNEEWSDEWGGHLELWDRHMQRCEARISPLENRAVIFTTASDSFHGHPVPMRCPDGVARQSLALYYFTAEEAPLVRSTEYRARPGDGTRALAIWTDKVALRLFDYAKRRFGISDALAGRVLTKLRRGSGMRR